MSKSDLLKSVWFFGSALCSLGSLAYKKKLLSFSAVQCSVVFILPLEVLPQSELFCEVPSTKNRACKTFFINKSIYCHTLSLNEENYYVKVISMFSVYKILLTVDSKLRKKM